MDFAGSQRNGHSEIETAEANWEQRLAECAGEC